jgi:mannose-6-phosphate isomerase-like protein (cupin superfamily)
VNQWITTAEALRHGFTGRNFSVHDFQTTKGANEAVTNPIIVPEKLERAGDQSPIAAIGQSFDVHEWSGSGPDYLHVHYADDEAWHVLEGTLTFRFRDKQVDAPAGTTIFVPAGVPHAYFEAHGPTRYLIILTPRLRDLIYALHATPREQHNAVMRRFESEILE